MAVEEFWAYHTPSKTVNFAIWRPVDGFVWDQDTNTFRAEGDAVDPFIPALERDSPGGLLLSMYVVTIDLITVYPGPTPEDFAILAYDQATALPSFAADVAVAQREMRVLRGELVTGAASGDGDKCCFGEGTTLVNQDYPCPGDLCITDQNGKPVDNAVINVFTREDWDAGRRGNEFIVASTRTDVFGNWAPAVMLDAGEYIIQVYKQGEFGPNHFPITVFAPVSSSSN